MRDLQKLFPLVLALLLGFLVGSGIQVEAHGGDTSKIHGCLGTTSTTTVKMGGRAFPNGTILRVVGANENCASNEVAMDWNIQGIQGIQGPSWLVNPLTNADLSNGDFRYHNFSGFTINNTKFDDSNLMGANFTNTLVANESFLNVNFKYANFSNVQTTNTGWYGGIFENVTATNGNFSGSHMGASTAYYSNFTGANLTNTTFGGGQYNAVNFNGANLTNAKFGSTALYLSTFTGAILTGVTFVNVTCPDLSNSDNNGGTCIGHGM